MIKKIAWDTFKNTGNINTFLELKEFEKTEKILNEEKRIKKDGEHKNQWNNLI